MLNPLSPLPLYHQLAELLLADIHGGKLTPGARLPSEPELSRAHRIGRPTVRQALDVLAQRGLVERRRGSGTFVREAPRRVDLFSLGGTLASFAKEDIPLVTTIARRPVLARVEVDAENPLSGKSAYSFSRLGRVGGTAVLLERLFLEASVFPDFARLNLAGVSLSRLVEERYYLSPSRAEQTFRVARPVPENVRELLELAPRQPVLLVKRTLHFPTAPGAVFVELYCSTEEFVFSQTIGGDEIHV